jgi:hypothetical protein
MRALREARYAATPKQPAAQVVPRPKQSVPAPQQKRAVATEVASDARCGHRSMNNRSCTREAGHPEKNHRYG